MGWELRNGKRYYYRKQRQGKRVTSEYLGTGELANLFSLIDQDESLQRHWSQAKWKLQKDEVEKLAKDGKTLALFIQHILRACLLTKGYHPHKGQWRKKQHDR
jgi:hypothetical protein